MHFSFQPATEGWFQFAPYGVWEMKAFTAARELQFGANQSERTGNKMFIFSIS